LKDPRAHRNFGRQGNDQDKRKWSTQFSVEYEHSPYYGDSLCIKSLKYMEKMIGNFKKIFAEVPKQNVTPILQKGDHPELDTSELFDKKGI
jgi:hypothetical protein